MRQVPAPVSNTNPMPLGPWVKGIVNTVNPHAIPVDGLEDALDCDIDREGFVYARVQYDALDVANGYRDYFESNGQAYAVSQGYVGSLGSATFTTIYPVNSVVGWTELNGAPVFCDHEGVYQINGLTAERFVIRPTIEEEDRYGLVDMPGGKAVAHWQGRLLVLRGRSLLWSEPLDYGCHSPARNFVRFPSTPTWMAALPSGVFVGLQDTVVFLSGTDPAAFVIKTVSGKNCPGASLVIDTRHFAADSGAGGLAAIWFSDVGFVVGRDGGSVVYPQAENIRDLPIVRRRISLVNERIYAFIDEG